MYRMQEVHQQRPRRIVSRRLSLGRNRDGGYNRSRKRSGSYAVL